MGLAEIAQLIQKRNFEKGIESLRAYMKENPRELQAHYYLGYCYFEMGDYERCIAALKEVIDRFSNENEDSVPSYGFFYLGIAQAREGNPDEALENLVRAREALEPEFLGHPQKLRFWVELYYFIGKSHIQLGNLEDGRQFLQKIVAHFPDPLKVPDAKIFHYLVFAQYYLALIAYMQEDFPESQRLLNKSADLLTEFLGNIKKGRPVDFFYPLYVTGKSLIIMEEYNRGLSLILAAKNFATDPEPLLILDYYLSRCYLKLGELPQARRLIDSVTQTIADQELEIDPDYIVNIFFTSGQISLDEENYEMALKEFQRVKELDADLMFINNILGDIYCHLKDGERAIQCYLLAIEHDPSDIYANLRIVQGNFRKGEIQERCREFITNIDLEKSLLPPALEIFLLRKENLKARPLTRPWREQLAIFLKIWEKNLFQYFDDPVE